MAEKPSVLVIGGLGYIGRFLARYLHDNGLASDVRLVDKLLPQMAWLPPGFEEACGKDKFVQADASRERTFSSCSLYPSYLYYYTLSFVPDSGRPTKNVVEL